MDELQQLKEWLQREQALASNSALSSEFLDGYLQGLRNVEAKLASLDMVSKAEKAKQDALERFYHRYVGE